MTHNQTDLRVRRTHMVLREALIALIEEKGFDAVTVADIAERAMVNRATFYRHYEDKYALVTGIFEEAVNQMFSEIGPSDNVEALLSGWREMGIETMQPDNLAPVLVTWSAFFVHFTKHARLYRVMLGKHGSSWFTAQMRDYLAEVIRQRAVALSSREVEKAVGKTDDPNAAPLEFVVIGLANWFVGMLSWWIENGMVYSPQQMVIWSARFAAYGYPSALGLHVPHPVGGVAVSDTRDG